MAEIPVKLIGTAQVQLHIGSHCFIQTILFTEGECIPRAADGYILIFSNAPNNVFPFEPFTIRSAFSSLVTS